MPPGSAIKEFLAWLDVRFAEEPAFQAFDQARHGVPVTVVRYVDRPTLGDMLAYTFGVSEPRAPGGTGTELVLAVASHRREWAMAFGALGEQLQGEDPAPGDSVDFGGTICDESGMTAFLFTRADALVGADEVVHLSDGHLSIVRAVPIHASELFVLREQAGPDERERVAADLLAMVGDDIVDVTRASAW